MKTFLNALFLLLFCSAVFAQDAPLETVKLKDGRDWIQMSRDAKIAFVTALGDLQAYHFLKRNILVEELDVKTSAFATYMARFVPFDRSVQDAVSWLDRFYWDGLNTNIPVIVALRVAALKFGLGPEEAVDKFVQAARQGVYDF